MNNRLEELLRIKEDIEAEIEMLENEEIVDWFLEQFSYRLDPISPFLPHQLRSAQTDKGYLQLLPGIHAADGFFMARFVKIATEKDKEK